MLKNFLFLFLAIAWADATAQDLETTQLLSNPFLMCPAQVGNAENPRASLLYRNNWANSFIAGFDAPVEKLHGGIGLVAVYDNHGHNYSDQSVRGVYSFHSDINDDLKIKSAVYLGLANKHFGVYTPTDTLYHPLLQEVTNKTYFDQGLSFALDYKKLSLGFSCFHLLKPDVGLFTAYRMDRRFSFYLGYDLWMMKGEKHEGIGITPLLYLTMESNTVRGTLGFDFVYNNVFAGAYYRMSSSDIYTLIYHAGLRVGRFQFGYAYDKTSSNLLSVSAEGHELFLNYFFEKK
ncbi:MAG: hypothetical protein A2W93_08380 [Bacteroidetes bacterium GWF2_43_63]|nr:MAG: hypothetical protein A2W94_15970 [Bacteroidetes bacterium GWE2_42_42]OFY53979.1 MAG: hypothetical protein A2W93_08380 [Bacteroidetes bacterium GWF2_43_63]HBG70587.1 hypothetical protein [Bacteroidales bacterium]HCB61467.1 hypothetical protein [Bacteroidales bacterium]HCY22057.1 hypothetical protein [Bacteroidales bacterium]